MILTDGDIQLLVIAWCVYALMLIGAYCMMFPKK